MAISKLFPRHAKGKRTVKGVITKSLDYDKNPDKTKDGTYISSYQCTPSIAVEEWLLTKAIYARKTCRSQPKERDIISYFVLQSFSPEDNLTPEQANEIGYQLAMELTEGNHQFVVCTHTDKEHLHNHIEFNSTNIQCDGKFHLHQSAMKLRQISDKICREEGLSVIENPKNKGVNYGEYRKSKEGNGYKENLRRDIDRLLPQCADLDELFQRLREEDYSIKIGKFISIKGTGQERYTRTKTLGEDYTEENLQRRIDQAFLRSEIRDQKSVVRA